MARSVGVLGTECRAEGIDASERGGAELSFELTAYGQAGHLSEEVLRVIHLALLRLRKVKFHWEKEDTDTSISNAEVDRLRQKAKQFENILNTK